ncbi:hypothetical protein M4D51_08065 [Microbacterium sp. p3-SID338]|uniref:hypothetical protein n=1 Tax=Microbacterium sp. p3-SID338 TaxID=2916214 RepID=UPI0021A84B0E|nr:hypothetical protein [Microbacterium sp. p3-SID338]MCT1395680.1 hypothetical protein [Microbacterium sp. p3-SID338]
MGGLVIETVRPGVQFTPDAAAAFRRAEAKVQAEFGRNIDVNSTYRSRDVQLAMFNAWNKYVMSGFKAAFYPGHSKALHPDDPLAFHTKGEALDSDDWVNARIVEILAENGFIRNRLYVPNEKHHFEWIRARDKNHGKPAMVAGGSADPLEEDDMPGPDKKLIVWNNIHYFVIGDESISYVADPAWLPYLRDHYGVRGKELAVDNGALTVELVINKIPWDAVDACLLGRAFGADRRSWSRLQAEGVAIRGQQATSQKTLEDVLNTATRIERDG